jgi:hypothetical protein
MANKTVIYFILHLNFWQGMQLGNQKKKIKYYTILKQKSLKGIVHRPILRQMWMSYELAKHEL